MSEESWKKTKTPRGPAPARLKPAVKHFLHATKRSAALGRGDGHAVKAGEKRRREGHDPRFAKRSAGRLTVPCGCRQTCGPSWPPARQRSQCTPPAAIKQSGKHTHTQKNTKSAR